VIYELSLRATDLLGQVETGMTTLQDRPAKSFVCVVVITSAQFWREESAFLHSHTQADPSRRS
jgi:hypothetical protein